MGIAVDGFPDYEIFEDGRVFSHKSNKFLKIIRHKNGYCFVELFNEHGSKMKSVHRIVATAFIDNPENLPFINHKDECRWNNNVENLEWCTAKYNSNYGTCIQRRVANTDYTKPFYRENAIKNGRKHSRPVVQLSLDGVLLHEYESGAEASRQTGIIHSHILECCAGKRYKTVGGYVWKYREKYKQEGSDDLLVSQ